MQYSVSVTDVSDANQSHRVRVADLGSDVAILFGVANDGGEAPWQITKEAAKNLLLALAEVVVRGKP